MKCSIIIPSFNTRELTLACVRAIHAHPPRGEYEIIVVDNNSQDGTCEALRREHPDTTAIQNPVNLGFGRACNQGVRIANGEYLLFLNSDTQALEGTFDALVEWLDAHPSTGIVGPELVSANGKLIQMSWAWNPVLLGEFLQRPLAPYAVRNSRLRRFVVEWLQRRARGVPIICGACMMVRRQAFESVRGFDERFELYFEDSDLCLRCRQQGWRVDFLPESKVVHHLGQSSNDPWGLTPLVYRQSQIFYYRKHAPQWAVPLLKAYLSMKCLNVSFRALRVRRRFPGAAAYVRNYWKIIREAKRLRLSDRNL